MSSLNTDILNKANYWASSEIFSENVRSEVKTLIDQNNSKELTDRFYRDLEFGTGGLRGIMGAGTSRMNIYNIRKASTALGLYLKELHGEGEIKVAISHDSRNRSREFAMAACEVLASLGITALITKEMRPVPVLSFMTRHHNCQAGICVTASHNPPAYNGFKVYWSNGGQLVPPHDVNIIEKYGSISSYEDLTHMNFEDGVKEGLIKLVGEDLDEAYLKDVESLRLNPPASSDAIKIVYSPIHGTGITMVPKAMNLFGFSDIHIVESQKEPNGDFPTVSSPNPEDPAALKLALDLGEEIGADIVLATDPDTDRIAVVVNEGGKFINFNGNQLGCLLMEYVLSSHSRNKNFPENPLVVKTIVTTKLQDEICKHYGVDCEDTLTGFKWICDLVERYAKGELGTKKTFVCGGEESYGFLAGNFVRDKDAVMSCAIACEMVAYYKSQGKKMTEVLDEIFLRHGVYHETLYTHTLPGKEGADKISEIMKNFRQDPPRELCGIKTLEVWDIKNSKKISLEDDQPKEIGSIDLPSSNVLQFFLADGSKISVRPSGTEPKIKFYISVKKELSSKEDLASKKSEALDLAQKLEKEFVALSK